MDEYDNFKEGIYHEKNGFFDGFPVCAKISMIWRASQAGLS
jgi:hypothetical protein